MKKDKPDPKKQLQDYVAFLEKRVNSAHFKANVSAEEIRDTKAKLDKARLRFRLLYGRV